MHSQTSRRRQISVVAKQLTVDREHRRQIRLNSIRIRKRSNAAKRAAKQCNQPIEHSRSVTPSDCGFVQFNDHRKHEQWTNVVTLTHCHHIVSLIHIMCRTVILIHRIRKIVPVREARVCMNVDASQLSMKNNLDDDFKWMLPTSNPLRPNAVIDGFRTSRSRV